MFLIDCDVTCCYRFLAVTLQHNSATGPLFLSSVVAWTEGLRVGSQAPRTGYVVPIGRVGIVLWNMHMTNLFPDNMAVFTFHQGIIVAVPCPRFRGSFHVGNTPLIQAHFTLDKTGGIVTVNCLILWTDIQFTYAGLGWSHGRS